MITVLCANTGVDKTFEVPNFALGGFYHPAQVQTTAGGKGVNVARVLCALGAPQILTGFAGGHNGRFLSGQLLDTGIKADLVPIAEESRLTVNIVDPAQRTQTRVDEVGPLVAPAEVGRLVDRWAKLMRHSDLAVIAGSAPRGASLELYAQLTRAAQDRQVPVILDAHDGLLARAIAARPAVIKPNLSELQHLAGRQLSVPDGVLEVGREIVGEGVGAVIVSLGARGAIAVTAADGTWWARSPKVERVSSVGSGDALVAGFAAAWLESAVFEERLRFGVAAGAANAATLGAGNITREQIEALEPDVELERLDPRPVDAGSTRAQA